MENVIKNISVLPLKSTVLFPKSILHADFNKKSVVDLISLAMRLDQKVFICLQKDPSVEPVCVSDLYKIGVVAKLLQVLKDKNGNITVVCEGLQRAKILSDKNDKCNTVDIELLTIDENEDTNEDLAFMRLIKELNYQYNSFRPKVAPDLVRRLDGTKNLYELSNMVAGDLFLSPKEKQSLLVIDSKRDFAKELINILHREIEILHIQSELIEKTKGRIDEHQREYFLNEELRTIQEELGENEISEVDEYRIKIDKLCLPEVNKTALLKECDRLDRMPFSSQEASLIRTYIESCLELPWGIYSKEKLDIEKVKKALDKHHYGLDKVKEKIIERIAVKILNPDIQGQILCLVGPPGVGKTSIAQSVAKAIGRESQRISLGGVKDEAEIRGHRRTYLGSMCGRIMDAIKKAGTSNPLLILDEIDKLSSDYKGDPASALLEVLDSEQNNSFYDHYIDMPYDLSKVMFITTANDATEIPKPLADRMEIIEIESYTREEKFHIAKKHLIPKQIKNCGMKASRVKISNDAVYKLIDCYTKEAGVRKLERAIIKLLSKTAVKIIKENPEKITIKTSDLETLIGMPKFKPDTISKTDEIGVATGLAWTSVGGEVLPIEVAVMAGTGKIELTGSLGDVMQESAKTAISYIRSNAKRFSIDEDFYNTKDIHIHAPEGAVPKDGPSAGITMATAIISAFTNMPVKRNVAMTGEITLRGKVLPIGGLKEKSMAAYKLGIDTVIIPQDNVPDIEEIDIAVKEKINFVPVNSFDRVLDIAFSDKIATE